MHTYIHAYIHTSIIIHLFNYAQRQNSIVALKKLETLEIFLSPRSLEETTLTINKISLQ